MRATSTALFVTLLLLGTSAAYAESEGNNLAFVEKPAGNGVYATYVTDGRGELVAVTTPPSTPTAVGTSAATQVSVSR